jgi:putative tryptophan/tyrosine transport system substrate-binding protein
MKRREFIAGLGSAVAWPVAARGQQRKLPIVGLLTGGIDVTGALIPAFLRGLAEAGYIEGRTVVIEYRTVNGEFERFPELAADLVHRGVDVIATPGQDAGALAAKAATTTIPIVFGIGGDPVQLGLVAGLGRPGGNITSYSEMNSEVASKRFGLLHELAPNATHFALLANPRNAIIQSATIETRAIAAAIGLTIDIITASTVEEIELAFSSLSQKQIGAMVLVPDPFYYGRCAEIAALAARNAIPAAYWARVFPASGGLMSYGSSITDMFHRVGVYAGRILRGDKPAELPVLQPTRFELVINARAAKALGLAVPNTLLVAADEVIE